MDGWDDRYLAQCQALVYKSVFEKKRRKVPDGVLGGYCRNTMEVRSTRRVLPKKDGGHV
jgi:hypothetical protein